MQLTTEKFNLQLALLKKLTMNFGPPDTPSEEVCGAYLDELEKSLSFSDSFFWVVNLKDQTIDRSAGVFRHLGYLDNRTSDSNSLRLYDIYNMVHEDMRELIQEQRQKALPYLFKKFRGVIKPLSHDFVYKVIVCFVKKNGESILVKQRSTAFQVDAQGNMLSYLSFHQIIKDYGNEAPALEIVIGNKRAKRLEKFVSAENDAILELPFTKREVEILKVLADFEAQRKSGDKTILSNQELATILAKKSGKAISGNTVHKHKTNILNKAKAKFPITFSKARDLALHLRKFNLI